MITAHDLADVEHDRWERCIEDHLGLVPPLLAMLLELAVPKIGVSRGGSRFDRPQITGGGYDEQDPTLSIDERAALDATYLWSLLAEYATAVSDWMGSGARIPDRCPGNRRVAHDASLLIVGALLQHKKHIYPYRELAQFEDEFFEEIRAMRARHGFFNTPRRRPLEPCDLCGEVKVRSHWVTGPTGPRSVEVKRCDDCGNEEHGADPNVEVEVVTEIDGKPIQAKGGISAADREAFAKKLREASRAIDTKEEKP